MGKNLEGVKVGDVPDRCDVSKNNPTGQLKRRGIYWIRAEIFLSIVNPSQTTFFGNNCKIVDPFNVNSFAKLYFFRKRPFHLPPHQRVIKFPIPEEKWSESK
jgi:hypothetical protein